jgi:predicted dehydrogenase
VIGTWGRGLLAKYAHCPENGVRVIAGADTSSDALNKFKESFGEDVFVTGDYRELLKRNDVDAVFVTTPDFLHEEHADAVLKADKALYIEKPLAITLEACDNILRTAMETGSKIFVGHNLRYQDNILKMKEIIDSGLIGKVQAGWVRHFINYGGDAYFKDWHSERKNTTGLLLQKGSHDIDVMHWLMGGYTKRVIGMGMLSVYDKCLRRPPEQNSGKADEWSASHWPPLEQKNFSPTIDVEDHSMIMMQLDNGAQGCYMQCHYTPDSLRNYMFIGSDGRLEQISGNEIYVWNQRSVYGGNPAPDIIYKLKEKTGGHGGCDPEIVKGFIDFVRFDRKPNTSPVAARNAVAAGVLGHASMRNNNEPAAIPPLPDELIKYFANGQVR